MDVIGEKMNELYQDQKYQQHELQLLQKVKNLIVFVQIVLESYFTSLTIILICPP